MTQGYHEYTDTSEEDARRLRRARRGTVSTRFPRLRWDRTIRRAIAAILFLLGLTVFVVAKQPDHVAVPDHTATAAESVARIDAGVHDVVSRIADPALHFAPEYARTDDPGGCGATVGTTDGWGMVAPDVRYAASVPAATAEEAQRLVGELRAAFDRAGIDRPVGELAGSVRGTRADVDYVAEYRLQADGVLFTLRGTGECVWLVGSRP